MTGTLHVIGAGIAGLACAVSATKAGRKVVLYEATKHVGGRCRSFSDTQLGMTVDNGSHAVLGANQAVFQYLKLIGAHHELIAVDETGSIPFVDIRTGERWALKPGDGLLPTWIFDKSRRAPGTFALDYINGFRILAAGKERTVSSVMPGSGFGWHRFWEPLSTAIMNTEANQASAHLFGNALWQTMKTRSGGLKSYVPRQSLHQTFIAPALEYLRAANATIHLNSTLVSFAGDKRVTDLQFRSNTIPLSKGDAVVTCLPLWSAAIKQVLPSTFNPRLSPIVNAHYAVDPSLEHPAMTGITGGTAQWVFTRPGLISATVSADQHLAGLDQGDIANRLWQDVQAAFTLGETSLPPHRIIIEHRATPVQDPAFAMDRPGPQTSLSNLFLAGDWTDTGLPCTLESAVRSGFKAADLAREKA
ncbi:MAG: hydroxysqualene dehydroxylase HpnE [Rhodospirillaceae bacterium]|nr:hydroxysqualene dehydroxylase HpnE [Rhodospirillaceae bacterium]